MLCFPFFLLFVLAETNICFLAMILPFPIIITIASLSVCFLDLSYPESSKQNSGPATDNTDEKLNRKIQTDDPTRNPESPCCQTNQTINESCEEGKCTSILTFVQAMILIFLLYECYFDLIVHLPIGSLLFCGTLATAFRVQCSLILISLHILPKEIVSTLTSIYQLQNKGNDVFKQTVHSDYFLNFLHIMRFRTRKHKRQNLIFKSNWRSVLNRISNFRTKYKFHACTDRSKQTEREESDKTDNLIPAQQEQI